MNRHLLSISSTLKMSFVGACFLVASLAHCEMSEIEKDVTLLSHKRRIAIAASRLPIEQAYLVELKKAYLKAESAKDLELQIKINDEMKIVKNNIEYFMNEKDAGLPDFNKKVFGVKWLTENGKEWVKIDDKKGTYWSNFVVKGGSCEIDGNDVRLLPSKYVYSYDADEDVLVLKGPGFPESGLIFFRNGRVHKIKSKAETPKAPEGEAIDTLFGRRVK